jgi:DNA polymerase III psi subunit
MGYYMRFISTDEQEITIPLLESVLKSFDLQYSVVNVQEVPRECGNLMYGNEIYGQIEINRPGDNLFEEELEELKESLSESKGRKKKTVLQTLTNAQTILAIQVLWQNRDTEQTLSKIDPLWLWLLSNRKGLLQADGEGYYDSSGLVLKE